jgi:hypothetical protein
MAMVLPLLGQPKLSEGSSEILLPRPPSLRFHVAANRFVKIDGFALHYDERWDRRSFSTIHLWPQDSLQLTWDFHVAPEPGTK